MFKILGRNIKKSIGLFLIFFIISLFFSVTASYIENGRQSVIIANNFFSDKSMSFQIESSGNSKDNITGSDFKTVIDKEDGIVLGINIGIDKGSSKNIDGTAIYFNKSCFNNPPVLTGRFFRPEDFKNDRPIALIGKNLKDILVIKDNKKYIFYDDNYYEVIGIMGYKNKSSIYDNRFVVNLNTDISDNAKFSRDINTVIWRLDNINSNARDSLKDIYNNLSKINKNVQIEITNESDRTSPLNAGS